MTTAYGERGYVDETDDFEATDLNPKTGSLT